MLHPVLPRPSESHGGNPLDQGPVADLHSLAIGYVADGSGRERNAVAFEGAQADLDGKLLPVLAASKERQPNSHGARAGKREKSLAISDVPFPIPLGHQELDALSEQFLAAIAEELFRLAVDQHDRPVAVNHHQGVRSQLHQAAKNPFILMLLH